MTAPLQPVAEIHYSNEPIIHFASLVQERGLVVQLSRRWRAEWSALRSVEGRALSRAREFDGSEDWLVLPLDDDALALVNHTSGLRAVTARVACRDMKACLQAIGTLRDLIPEAPPPAQDQVEIRFWMNTQMGPKAIVRPVTVPAWQDIATNYAGSTLAQLSPLLADWRPSTGGQMILWHGAPGTGKTYAIRSLVRSWKSWCQVDYVTDPEAFFGEASYLLSVLVDPDHHTQRDWRLVILEDAGELMAADARERSGQGLSRLLNVTDGLIGQGLNIIVLVTTNEEIQDLHPAVARPGRCASIARFDAFSSDESSAWLRARGVKAPTRVRNFTLAELYAQLEREERIHLELPTRKVGFG